MKISLQFLLSPALLLGAAFSSASLAQAQDVQLDQVAGGSNSWFFLSDPSLVWQQQVRAGLGGYLDSFELHLRGTFGSEVEVRVRVGDGWNDGPVVWSQVHPIVLPGGRYVRFDLRSSEILLGAGETFVIEVEGSSAEIGGSFVDPGDGPPNYPEDFFLNGPGCYEVCGHRLRFRTWMDTDLSESFCVAIPNSTGQPSSLSELGSFSVSDNALSLLADNAPPGQTGLVFYGPNVEVSLFGNGLRCVGGPGALGRLAPAVVNPMGQLIAPLDFTQPSSPGTQIDPGSTWYFQAWYRDPAGGGAGFHLSDGLQITFLP